jgi:O-antigen ligase
MNTENLKSLCSQYMPLILLCIWVGFYFSYLGWKPGFAYNAQRYFEIVFLGCLLCAGLLLPLRFRMENFWRVSCLILLFIMLLVLLQADIRWLAVREGLQYLALFAAILVVAKTRAHAGAADFDRAAYLGLVLFSFGCSLIVLEGLVLSLSIGMVDHRVIFGAFVNLRIFAELQFLTLLFLPSAALQMDSAGWRRFASLTAILGWGLLFFSGTRSALVAIPFALLMVWFVVGSRALSWFRLLAGQFAGGVLFLLILRGGIAATLDTSAETGGTMSLARASSGGRLNIWADAGQYFLENPWFGNGPGAFACLTDKLVATPHNLFLQLLSEWGVLMTLLCLALALLMFFALVRRLRDNSGTNALHFALFATLVITVAASMMEGMVIAPLQQMLIVLVFGWALHVFAGEKFVSETGTAFVRHQVRYGMVLAVFLSITLWGVKADLTLQRQLLVSPEGVVNLSYGPRFWADGHDHCPDWHERYENR